MISRGINGSSFVNVVIMEVPFIDAIADMIDPTVPWVEFEWYEWGNPLNKTIYDAMMDYSPYENIRLTSFPSILVTSGFLDVIPMLNTTDFIRQE